MSFTKPIVGYRRVDTRAGDTLQDIAARELGDAARWYDLANLNNLLPPYITDDLGKAGPRVLFSGSTIMIPGPAPAASGVADPATVFGSDAALANGQLVDDGNGDFAIVSGIPNLDAAILHRLRTRPGELIYHPRYGCKIYDLIGDRGSDSTNQLAGAFVASAVRTDPRVSKVQKATATISGDSVSVSATAVTVDGKKLPVGLTQGIIG